ncbi:MAG: elongation factor G [Staphylococcus sp.]|mgnify:FL=1|nr:elongation factor G [Staphylococcus sp.]
MKEYLTNQIRNVAILGHLGSGKTSLVESMLYISKAINKKGEVERKNTVSDYLVEEQNRQTSLSTSLIPVEWNNYKINFLDTPGSEEFVGEIEQDLAVVKGAVILLDAQKGVEVGTERVWDELRIRHTPTILFINKIDKENVKFDKVIDSIIDKFGSKVVPFVIPIGKENDYQGYIDIIKKKAYLGETEQETEIPNDYIAKVDEAYDKFLEIVASQSEEVMEKYFSGDTLSNDEIISGLRSALLNCDIFPILVGSATKNMGLKGLLDKICKYLPSPADLKPANGINPKTNKEVSRVSKDDDSFSAYVFKTIVDPFLGTINFFKVYSGTTKDLTEVYIPNSDQVVKVGVVALMMGKNQLPIDVLHAGDIGVLTKSGDIKTGDTLCDKKDIVLYPPIEIPTPVIYVAIQAKTKQDEDKISSALQKLNLEDPTFEVKRNPETSQLLVGGQGMTHIGYILEKMKNMFKVDVSVADQKIVYRETIRKVGSAQGRHKKQSGGAGQFGDVWIRFEPLADKDFEFASEVVGGSVPKNFFPAVEKGLIDTLEHGPIAGFPVIGVRAVLYDGSYHPVDSNEISFKIAASLAFKEACKFIKPTILEPIMEVVITVKDEYVGDIMSDIPQRRGSVVGMEPVGNGKTAITAQIPEAEIIKYTIDLKAMTQGSGYFTRKFIRYDDVPSNLVDKIVAEYKKDN